MIWDNKGHQFGEIYRFITENKKNYEMWGYGSFGKKFYSRLKGKIQINQVADTNECGCELDGQMIQDPENMIFNKQSVILVTALSAYEEIAAFLLQKGYVENEDFINARTFMEVFFAYEYNKLYLNGVDLSITERCTLKCRKCNMFMAYFEEPKDRELEALKEDIDLFFSHVQNIEILNILGGEPFLYKELVNFLQYLSQHYRESISSIAILSNGMVRPDDETLKFLQMNPQFFLKISDYTKTIPYKEKLDANIKLFQSYGISYEMVRYDSWMDFGFPEEGIKLGSKAAAARFENCMPPFRGLYDGKFYFCHVQTSAIRAGLYLEEENDFLDLKQKIDKKIFLEFDRGYSEKGYVTMCENCRGCGTDNTVFVDVAEQKEK